MVDRCSDNLRSKMGRTISRSSSFSVMVSLSSLLLLSTATNFFVDSLLISRHNHQRNQQSLVLSAATGLSLEDLGNARTQQMQQPSSSVQENDKFKVGVLFLNLGGPATGEDVEG